MAGWPLGRSVSDIGKAFAELIGRGYLGSPSILASLFTAAQRGDECQFIVSSSLAIGSGLPLPVGEIGAETVSGSGAREARPIVLRGSYDTEGVELDCAPGVPQEINPAPTSRIATTLEGVRIISFSPRCSSRTASGPLR